MKILGMTVSQSTYDEITHGDFFRGLQSLRHAMHLDLRSAKNLAEKIRGGEVKPDPEEPIIKGFETKLSKYPWRTEINYYLFNLRVLESLPLDQMDRSIVMSSSTLDGVMKYAATLAECNLFDDTKWGVSVDHKMWAMIDGQEVEIQSDRSSISFREMGK